MEGQQYSGAVKSFKGSFGWVTCAEVAEKFGGRDTFLHKKDVNGLPVAGCRVRFRLVLDAKGNPKAEDAVLEVEPLAADAKAAQHTAEGLGAAALGATVPAAPDVRRAALMLSRGEELLLLREDKEGHLRWSDLGGKVEAGEALLDCALRELAEEAQGFLAAEDIELLDRGLRQRYSDGKAKPKLVTLKSSGEGRRPHMVAVFPMDCTGMDLEILSPDGPNAQGVHELCWINQAHPDLRDRNRTRWPLLRALCALQRRGGRCSRSRSRSLRCGASAGGELAAEGLQLDGNSSEGDSEEEPRGAAVEAETKPS